MARGRFIDYDLESERTAEWLLNNRREQIKDRDTFNLAFNNDIAQTSEADLSAKDRKYREQVFEKYKKHFPKDEQKQLEEKVFSKAGGKDLRRDRLKTAKEVVKTKEKYIKRGAPKVDLEAFDTKDAERIKRLTLAGLVKGRTVKVERAFVTIKGKRFERYRDRLGRFASRKV